jgi:hypothetical protein
MRRGARRVIALVGLTCGVMAGAGLVDAQVRGIPVYNSGVASGIAVYGNVGFPNDPAGGGAAFALTGRAGFGPFGATAILSTYNPDGPVGSDVSVGGTLNYKLFGGPLIPLSVTLQGGIGYAKPDSSLLPDADIDELRFPVGLGFALIIPNPVLAIRPWIAPRLDIVRRSTAGVSDTETNFGLGGGLELNLLSGLGMHAAYDRVFADGGDPSVFGVGVHYAFRIPGL